MYLLDLLVLFLIVLVLFICVLVGVAFLTLLERKVLGYIQIRKGPNKVGMMGILQPFSDAIKLFSKEQTFPLLSNYLMYYYSPIMSLFLSLMLWILMPYILGLLEFKFGMLFFLCCVSLGVYTVMIAGWSSNSSYSLLGSMRSIAQTISYEVSLSLIFFSFMLIIGGFDLMYFYFFQNYVWMIFLLFPLSMMWFVSCLAETNRTPFDFAEGESELVSGFNVEYSSGGFALIFLSEYSSILFMSMLFVLMFMGSNLISLMFYFKMVFLSFLFLWVRGTLPRFRYDKLMYLAWKSFLPISLNFIILYLSFKIYLFMFF